MKRSFAFFLVVCSLISLSGCGGGDDDTPAATPVLTTITLSPSAVSLNRGAVQQMLVDLKDQNNNNFSATVTFNSSNTAVATVSPSGLVCAGTWDTNFINCTPGPVGTANITATSGSVTSNVVVVSSHERVDAVTLTAPGGCSSQGQTGDLTARAFSNGVDITSTVGTFNFSSTQGTVATFETQPAANVARLKAVLPGATAVHASISGVNSPRVTFTTCPVTRINLHLQNSPDTTINLAAAGNTATLVAEAFDSNGTAITNPGLTFTSLQPVVASVSSTGVVTANQPGTSGVVASCTSGTCNVGLPSAFSNLVTVNSFPGNSASTTVYAGTTVAPATGNATLIPIDTGTNAAGTAITLPNVPTSIRFLTTGTRAYIGSASAMNILDASSNTVTSGTAVSGVVFHTNATRVLSANPNFAFSLADSGVAIGFPTITNAVAGVVAPDNSAAFFVGGGNLYFIPVSSVSAVFTYPLGGTLADVTMLANGQAAYVAGPGNQVTVVAACDASVQDTIPTTAAPQKVAAAQDGRTVIATDGTRIYEITATVTSSACPQTVTHTVASADMGMGAITVADIIVSPDSTKAYVIGNTGSIVVYNITTNTVSTIPLAGGATAALAADITLDSKTLWVAANNSSVQRVDLTTNTVVASVNLSFQPNLLAVRPR